MNILRSFEHEKSFVFEKLDLLYEALQNLHYEGKVLLLKNARLISETVQQLKPILRNHADLDEQVIFPFASKHIPILQIMIAFLKAERNEFTIQLNSFDVLFNELTQCHDDNTKQVLLEKIRVKGVYSVCIVRNHMQAELEGVYKVLESKLKLIEKQELYSLIQRYEQDKKMLSQRSCPVNRMRNVKF